MPEDELGDVRAVGRGAGSSSRRWRRDSGWCDDRRTPEVETCAAFQAASLARRPGVPARRLGPDPSGWRWERLHRAVFPHDVFHEVPVLRRFFDLEIGQGGDGATVNVGAFSQDGSFEMDGRARATARSSTSPIRPRAATCITTGQSGNVFSRRYRDLLPEWRAGR